MHSASALRQKSGLATDPGQTPNPRDRTSLPRHCSMPNIIGFDGVGLGTLDTRKNNGYFPPRKLKSSKGTPRMTPTTRSQQLSPDNSLALETRLGVTSPRPLTGNSSSASDVYMKRDRFRPKKSRETPRTGGRFSARYTPDPSANVKVPEKLTFQKSKGEEEIFTGDLSYLTKPKAVEPGRCSPWVYRYKVKRSMNNLAKIMASQPNSTTMGYRLAR
ncbi:uncharacterized protein LOC135482338 isoform X2 [Liolophura sinensis]